MSPKQQLHLASPSLQNAYSNFILSRQQCTQATLEFYKYTAGWFLLWAEQQGITSPDGITAQLIHEYLAGLAEKEKKDTTCHAHARAIRTLVRYWHAEGYIPEVVKVDMPKLSQKRLPILSPDRVDQVLKACNVRDNAIVSLMVDTGLRLSEVVHLNWGDVDMSNRLIHVKQANGKRARIIPIGFTAQRALLEYRRTLENVTDETPMFLTHDHTRFTSDGFSLIFKRLSKRTGIHVSALALYRTFIILALRSGMNVLEIQAMLGNASFEMIQYYAQMVDKDLLPVHREFSLIDSLEIE